MELFLTLWMGSGFVAYIIMSLIQMADRDPAPATGDVLACVFFGPFMLLLEAVYATARALEARRG